MIPPPAETSPAATSVIKSDDSSIIDLKSIILTIEWEITDRLMKRLQSELKTLAGVYQDKPILIRFLKIMKALGQYIAKKKAEAHPDSIKLMAQAFNGFEKIIMNPNLPGAEQRELLQNTVKDFNRLKTLLAEINPPEAKSEAPAEDTPTAEAVTDQAPAEETPAAEAVTDQAPAEETPAAEAMTAEAPVEETPAAEAMTAEAPVEETPAAEAMTAQAPAEVAPAEEVPTAKTPTAGTDRTEPGAGPPAVEGPSLSPSSDYAGMAPHEAFALAVEELKQLIKSEFSALRAEIKMWRQGQ